VNDTTDLDQLIALGVGGVALALQLSLGRRSNRFATRPARLAGAVAAVMLCIVLLAIGHQAPRTRSPRHESFEGLLLRDRSVAVSYETSRPGTTGLR
jgi:hypothetical protein